MSDAPLLLGPMTASQTAREIRRLRNELVLANDLLHDVVLGHNLRTKNRKMWTSVLHEDDSLTMLHLHRWFLRRQDEWELRTSLASPLEYAPIEKSTYCHHIRGEEE